MDNKKIFPKIWIHEVMRIFYDRLIEDKDRKWVYDKLRTAVKTNFREEFDATLDSLPHDEETGKYVIPPSFRHLKNYILECRMTNRRQKVLDI